MQAALPQCACAGSCQLRSFGTYPVACALSCGLLLPPSQQARAGGEPSEAEAAAATAGAQARMACWPACCVEHSLAVDRMAGSALPCGACPMLPCRICGLCSFEERPCLSLCDWLGPCSTSRPSAGSSARRPRRRPVQRHPAALLRAPASR